MGIKNVLHLSAGGCGVCKVCAKRTNEPCRFPEKAITSLEAYGINVSRLAAASDMKYINGQNTVTYFGAVLFSISNENE
jgi:predicted metal-binding protein